MPHPPVVILESQHQKEVEDFLARDPTAHVYQLAQLERDSLAQERRGTWTACRSDSGKLRAVLYCKWPIQRGPALNALPAGEPAACGLLGQRLARRGGTRLVVGARAACDALWLGMRKPWFRIAYDQRLYVCDAVPEGPTLPVEPARLMDVEDLVPMHSQMLHEDLRIPLESIDEFAQWTSLHRGVSTGRYLVVRGGTVDEPLRFCIDIGTMGSAGTQVGGTFVPKTWRGQGIASAAMRGVVRYLLEERNLPCVTLHVHEENHPAVRCYERAAFKATGAFRLMVR